MRITTNAIMQQYTGRLNNVLGELNLANDKVTTGRKFSKASQDPSNAVKAYQLRREFLKNDNYLANAEDTQGLFDAVESSMMQISKVAEDAYVDILTVINGTNSPSERSIIADKLREMQKTMVKDVNITYAGKFLFGGSSTKGLPFELSDGGELSYRGVNVTTGEFTNPETGVVEIADLKALAEEKSFVDLGFGLSFDKDSKIIEGSAYDMSTTGLNFLGYGQTGDQSNNIILTLGKIADELDKPVFDDLVLRDLNTTFQDQRDNILVGITKLGSNSMFLDYTVKRLDNNNANYNTRLLSTEYMDTSEAITGFKMADYAYRATLKMGVDILSPSFIDFMK